MKIRKILNDKGQAIAEFAILAPVLLFFIMGIFQVGYMGLVYVVVNHTVFQVARVACVDPDSAYKAAQQALPFKSGGIRVDISSPGGTEDLEVTLTYNMPLYFPFINEFFRQLYSLPDYSFPVRATCLMKKEPV